MSALGTFSPATLTVSNSAPLPEYIAADGNPEALGPTGPINQLSNVTITNANLTASEIPALDYFPATNTVSVGYGGTGISSAPSYGQLLLGNASGGYTLTATSSLGISGGGGGTPGGASGQVQLNGNGSFVGSGSFTFATTTSLLTVTNASTSALTASYASTSNLIASNSFTLGSITGVLHAVAGVISASLVNLASDVTGILPVANGGTGWSNLAAGAIPYGNGSSALATTSVGTAGQVLALLNGVPTWTATTTLANISGTLAASQGGTGTTTWQTGSIPFFNSTQFTENNADLFWDNTNNRLGLATTTPGSILSIQGVANWTTATSTYYSTGGINLLIST